MGIEKKTEKASCIPKRFIKKKKGRKKKIKGKKRKQLDGKKIQTRKTEDQAFPKIKLSFKILRKKKKIFRNPHYCMLLGDMQPLIITLPIESACDARPFS